MHPEYIPQPKLKLEIMVPNDLVDAVVQAIHTGAHTGNPGDGRIFVTNLESTVKSAPASTTRQRSRCDQASHRERHRRRRPSVTRDVSAAPLTKLDGVPDV